MSGEAGKRWTFDPDRGFVWDAAGNIICQLWDKTEEDFDHAEVNGPIIASAPKLAADRDVLLAALRGLVRMVKDGWITPEDHPTDYEIGWEAACAQFKVAKTTKLTEQAIVQVEEKS